MPDEPQVTDEQQAADSTGAGNGSGNGEAAGWFDSLPQDLQQDKTISMYKNKEIGDFAKSFLDNKRLAGEKLRIPKDDNPDEWGKIYSALGRPEKPDGYKQPELELPEGVEFQWDDKLLTQYRNKAHEMGLNDRQFNELAQLYANEKIEVAKMDTDDARYEQAMNELKNEWGDDQFKRNLATTQNALKQILGDAEFQALNESLGNNALFIKYFHKITQALGEDRFMDSSASSQQSMEAQWDELSEKEMEIRQNPQYIMRSGEKGFNPIEHAELVKKIAEIADKKREIRTHQEMAKMQAGLFNQ